MIRGSIRDSYGPGSTFTASWHFTDLEFRLSRVRSAFGATTAIYKVRGDVSYSERKTGRCAHAASATFQLPQDLPKHPSVPLALVVDPTGKRTAEGYIVLRPKLTFTETCPGSTRTRTVAVPSLFNIDVAGWRSNRPLRHTVHYGTTSGASEAITYDLKPGL